MQPFPERDPRRRQHEAAVEAVRLGFREWGENPQLNAPRRRIHIPTGVRVSVHQGGVPAANATGLMTHCEWVKPMAAEQVYPRLNHPVIVLYDSAEGELKGIIVGEITCSELPDNIAVTGLRTAATSAVGTDLLARPDATSLGLFGAAGQAKNHLLALMQVRKLKNVKVYSRNAREQKQVRRRNGTADQSQHHAGCLARRSRARRRYCFNRNQLQRAGLRRQLARTRPARHDHRRQQRRLGKDGFTAAKRREIDDATLARSHVLGIVSVEQAMQDEQADIFDPSQRGVIRWEQLIEIGEILAGKKEGRTKAEQITFYKNNAGQGVADVALGAKVLDNIQREKAGQKLNY